nr:MAG: hypothetical protein [Microvirus Sku18]
MCIFYFCFMEYIYFGFGLFLGFILHVLPVILFCCFLIALIRYLNRKGRS